MAEKNTVMKDLNPQDETALSNIIAIAQEILESGSQGQPPQDMEQGGDDMAQDSLFKDQYSDEEDEKKKPEEGNKNPIKNGEAKKAIETTSSDGGIAGDDPEDNEEDNNTEATNQAIAQVAKMLLGAMGQKQVVKKSKVSPMVQAINSLAQVVQKQAERQTLIAKTLEQLLVTTGITSQLEIIQKSQAPAPKKVVSTTDMEQFANYVAKAINPQAGGMAKPQNVVNKSQAESVRDEILDLVGSFKGMNRR